MNDGSTHDVDVRKTLTDSEYRAGRGRRTGVRNPDVTLPTDSVVIKAPNRKTVEHIKVAADGRLNPYTLSTADALLNRDRYLENDVLTSLDTGTPVLPDLSVSD